MNLFCESCGGALTVDAKFCPGCALPVRGMPSPVSADAATSSSLQPAARVPATFGSSLPTAPFAAPASGPARPGTPRQPFPVKHRLPTWAIVLITVACIPMGLMVVGVIAAVAIPVFLHQSQAAIEASMKTDATTMAAAQEAYLTDNPASPGYPVELSEGSDAAVAGRDVSPSPGNRITVTIGARGAYCVRVDNAKAASPVYFDPIAGGLTFVACDH